MFDQKIDESVFESELLRSCEQQQPFWCLSTRFLLPNKHKKREDLMTGPRKLSPFCRGVAERGCPRGGFRCYKRPPVDTCTHSWVASVTEALSKTKQPNLQYWSWVDWCCKVKSNGSATQKIHLVLGSVALFTAWAPDKSIDATFQHVFNEKAVFSIFGAKNSVFYIS